MQALMSKSTRIEEYVTQNCCANSHISTQYACLELKTALVLSSYSFFSFPSDAR
jgi:hypothetical protein